MRGMENRDKAKIIGVGIKQGPRGHVHMDQTIVTIEN